MSAPLVDQSKIITVNDAILDEPHVRLITGISDEATNNAADNSFVDKKVLIVKKKNSTGAFAAGASDEVIDLAASKSSFVPANSYLRLNVTCTDFWTYPRNGAAGLIRRVHVTSGDGATIEDIDTYNRVCQKKSDVDFNSSYVRQHQDFLESAGAAWKVPVEETWNVALTAVGSLVTLGGASEIGNVAVGSIIYVLGRYLHVTAVNAGGDELTVAVLSGAAMADDAAADETVRFYPSLDSETGLVSVISSQFMGKALTWLPQEGDAAGAEMIHSFYGMGYLTGDEQRHLWMTNGLQIRVSFNNERTGLYALPATAGTFSITHMSYDYQNIQHHPAAFAELVRQFMEVASNPEIPGPLLHFTTHTVMIETVPADVAFNIKWTRTRESVDGITMWRIPTTSESNIDVDTAAHMNDEYATIQLRYSGGSYDLTREPLKSMKQLYNNMYVSSEHNSSRDYDSMNLVEWKARPYAVFNTQQYEISDNYTGLKTSNGKEIELLGTFGAAVVAQKAVVLAAYRQRLAFTYDGTAASGAWRVEAVQKA